MFVAHTVFPDQIERDPQTGKIKPIQPGRHEVTLWSMDMALISRLGLLDWLDVRLRFKLRFVDVRAAFTDKDGKPLPDYSSIHHRNETLFGPGDPDVQVGFRPLRPTRKQPWLLEFGGGLSFPLGRIEPDPYTAGREGKEHQHIMFGSGTFDPIGFLTAGYLAPSFQLYANVLLRGAILPNRYGFQQGMTLRASLSAESAFGLRQWSFQARAAFLLARAGLWSGKLDPDAASGRVSLLLTASVFWEPRPNWQLGLQASAPINLFVEGGDLLTPFVIGLSLQVQFRLFR